VVKTQGLIILLIIAAVAFYAINPIGIFSIFNFPGNPVAGQTSHIVFNMPFAFLQNSPICNIPGGIPGGGMELISTSYKIVDTNTHAIIVPLQQLAPPTGLPCALKNDPREWPVADDYWTPPYSDQPRAITYTVWWNGQTGVLLGSQSFEGVILPADDDDPDPCTVTNAEACDVSEVGNTRCKDGVPQTCEVQSTAEMCVTPDPAWQIGGDACNEDDIPDERAIILWIGIIILAAAVLRSQKML